VFFSFQKTEKMQTFTFVIPESSFRAAPAQAPAAQMQPAAQPCQHCTSQSNPSSALNQFVDCILIALGVLAVAAVCLLVLAPEAFDELFVGTSTVKPRTKSTSKSTSTPVRCSKHMGRPIRHDFLSVDTLKSVDAKQLGKVVGQSVGQAMTYASGVADVAQSKMQDFVGEALKHSGIDGDVPEQTKSPITFCPKDWARWVSEEEQQHAKYPMQSWMELLSTQTMEELD
jgi:hypothetical protein